MDIIVVILIIFALSSISARYNKLKNQRPGASDEDASAPARPVDMRGVVDEVRRHLSGTAHEAAEPALPRTWTPQPAFQKPAAPAPTAPSAMVDGSLSGQDYQMSPENFMRSVTVEAMPSQMLATGARRPVSEVPPVRVQGLHLSVKDMQRAVVMSEILTRPAERTRKWIAR